MSNWDKSDRTKAGNDLRAVLFISRNRDNSHVEGFKERKKAFVAWFDGMIIPGWLEEEFNEFVKRGQPSEFSRMYISINARDPEKIKKYLTIKLIENPEHIYLTNIEPIIAGIAAKVENRRTDQKRWLFDWDYQDQKKLKQFVKDIEEAGGGEVFSTPHGAAVLAEHGFDNRKLRSIWGDVAVPKKDDLWCARWCYNLFDANKRINNSTQGTIERVVN